MTSVGPADFKIGHHTISDTSPCLVIAEAGVNHNGDVSLACELIRAAKRAGADCVKFQTFHADQVVGPDAPKAVYQLHSTDPTESQHKMLERLELDESAYVEIIAECERTGILFASTPYNEDDVDFLESLDVPFYKAASMHCVEPRFLQKLAATGRPVILSTGMASWNEIDEAVAAIRATGNEKLVLLQCTTNYPSTLEEANLRVMPAMAKRYNCFFGYSDHTQEHTACLAAVALGARAVERHFTLDRSLPGPDHQASDEPSAFTELVAQIRNVELTRGSDEKQPTASELLNSEGMRRSLVARRAIPTGTRLTDEDLICQRPATGLEPRYWSDLVGLIAKRDIAAGTQISFEDFHG